MLRCLASPVALGYRCIARVVKTHGIKGEVVAVPADGLPPVLSQGLKVALVPPVLKQNRWHTVGHVETSDAGQLVAFDGISTTSEAHELVGKYVLAQADGLEELDEFDELEALMGLEVIDERLGLLGTVSEVLEGSVQDILVVRSEQGETMIPLVEELVWYSETEDYLESALPQGLAPWDTQERE